MSAVIKISRRVIQITDGIVNNFVLIVILLLFALGCYAIWDSGQVYSMADASQYEAYKPTAENYGLSFNDLQSINPEVFAWLTVFGTHIDYPLLQGESNLKYINTDAKGKYSLSGSIFLDVGNSPDFSDFSSILYGHHMDKKAMFGEIGLFEDKNYFDARKYGSLYYNGQEHGLEFFAFLHVDAYDTIVFRTKITELENRQSYLDMLIRTSMYIRKDVTVTTADQIVLLSTCSTSSTNGRDILIGKITEKTYTDPFQTTETDKTNVVPMIGALPSLWEQTPVWGRIIIMALPFLLILLVVVFIYMKKKRSRIKEVNTHGRNNY